MSISGFAWRGTALKLSVILGGIASGAEDQKNASRLSILQYLPHGHIAWPHARIMLLL